MGCYDASLIEKSLFVADILKLNQDEMKTLMKMMGFAGNRPAFINFLMTGYSIDSISLTSGDKGSQLFTKHDLYRSPPADVNRIVDSVGAGDAYAAMLAAGLLNGWHPKVIVQRASTFASRICEIKGAIPDSASFYEPFKTFFKAG
jgi:fructokinase